MTTETKEQPRNYAPYEPKSSNGKTFDIGVVIALAEEFKHFLDYIQRWNPSSKPRNVWVDDHSFWTFEVNGKSGPVSVVALCVGEMGTEYTAVATHLLVEKWHVPFLINIGLTGSFDKKDLKVGSILIPTVITHYSALGKIIDKKEEKETQKDPTANDSLVSNSNKESDHVEFLLGTRAFATNRVTVSQFNNFLVSSDYKDWQRECMTDVDTEGCEEEFGSMPAVVLGHLASGNHVIDSERYKKLLKKSDRKLMGCEMEAAGFAIAEQFLQASAKATSQFIALRCISDFAANKDSVEIEANAATANKKPLPIVNQIPMQNREYAMRNATCLFLFLIQHGIINADVSAQLVQLEGIVQQLNVRKKEAAKRPLASENLTVQDMLAHISKEGTQKSFKEFPLEKKKELILHLSPNNSLALSSTATATAIDNLGIELLRGNSLLKQNSRAKVDDNMQEPEKEDSSCIHEERDVVADVGKVTVLDNTSNREDNDRSATDTSLGKRVTVSSSIGGCGGEDTPGVKKLKTSVTVKQLLPVVNQLQEWVSRNSDKELNPDAFESAKQMIEAAMARLTSL